MKNKLLALMFCFTLAFSSQSYAHHDHATQSDMDHLVTIKGTVTKFLFVNPHEILMVDAKNDSGVEEQWTVYGGAPIIMSRVGWNSNLFKPGEQLKITGFPNRDGKKTLIQARIERSNGEVIRISQTEQTELDAILRKHQVQSVDKLPQDVHRLIGPQ